MLKPRGGQEACNAEASRRSGSIRADVLRSRLGSGMLRLPFEIDILRGTLRIGSKAGT